MDLLSQQLFNGLVLGMEYALFAVGLVLVFSVLRVMNFAHGALFAWGGIVAVLAVQGVDAQVVIVALLAGVAMGAFIAFGMQRGIVDVLNRKGIDDHLIPAVATIGVSWMLTGLGAAILGPNPRSFPEGTLTPTFHDVGPIEVTTMQLVIVVVALIALAALDRVVFKTKLGRRLRAVAYAPDNAELLGINVRRMRTAAFVISGALAGLAGALTSLTLDLASPFIAEGTLVKGFAIIVLGGMGSVRGAVIGALLLGEAEVLTVNYGASTYRDAVAGILLFVVLMIRPQGLFGRAEVARA